MSDPESAIWDDAYNKYCENDRHPKNARKRPPEQTFFEALNTVDMNATPQRQETLKVLKGLLDASVGQ